MHLEGFLNTDHILSPRRAFQGLNRLIKPMVQYSPASAWEVDTCSLPSSLQTYRRKIRQFARAEILPLALEHDLPTKQPEALEQVIKKGAKYGLLTDLLPYPFGIAKWRNLLVPPHLIQCIKLEEISAVCGGFGTVFGAHALGKMPLILSGDLSAIRKFLLPAYRESLNGNPHVMAFAITEPGAGSDAQDGRGASLYRPTTTAKKVEGGWLLNGTKIFISGGDIAQSVSVFAALEGEGMDSWSCFLLQRGMDGFTVGRKESKMGQRASAATELIMDNVFVPDSHLVGELYQGWGINRAVLNYSRIPVGAIALGIARGAMESAVEFASSQSQGGKPLINYQEVQLAIAQMLMEVSAMRCMVWNFANTWTLRQSRASMAKTFCSDTAVKVCERAMELMGNHGILHHKRAEKAYRDARLTQIYEGTNEINRLAVIEDQMEELATLTTYGSNNVQ